MYFLKIVGLDLLYWLLTLVEELLWIIIILVYFGLLVLIITNFPEPYSYYAGAVGAIIGFIIGVMYLPDISTWTLGKKEKLKKEQDKLKQINNK